MLNLPWATYSWDATDIGRLPIAIMGPISQRSRSKGVAVKVFELIGAAKNIDRPSRLDGFSGEM